MKIREQMKTLAASYTPQWSFSETQPDTGSVVALLYADMLEESLERYGKVLHKHKIQYLNLFDRFKDEPVESAKSFVRFMPVTGAPDAVHIPQGTRLYADSEQTGGQVVFETGHGVTVTPAQLSSIYLTDGTAGIIDRKFSAEDGQSAEGLSFTAFWAGDENLEEHRLILGFEDAFDHLDRLDLELEISVFPEDRQEQTLDAMCGEDISFAVLCEGGFEPFDLVERMAGGIHLVKENFKQQKADLSGVQCCHIEIAAARLCDIQINAAKLRFSENDIIPDEVRCAGVAQNPEHFRPFGVPMELYSAWEIESKLVFARRGAQATVSFRLDFETVERLLPEYEVAEDYRVIMRQPLTMPKPTVLDVYAQNVLPEYLSRTGWKRLIKEEHAALIFGGSEQGEITLSFRIPDDMLDSEYAAGQPRLRFRLIRADGLYQIPCRQHCPVVSGLRLSYDCGDFPRIPDRALTINNFEHDDVTGQLRSGKGISLFYSRECELPAMYFAFEGNPWGSPISLYLRLENNADYPVDFTAEYLSPEGYLPLKVADGTTGMLSSGALRIVVPQDITPKTLFGHELYWIRLVSHNKEHKEYHLPLITGIYLNMAKVENVRTQTQYFYPDSTGAITSAKLDGGGLISAKVYVNEQDASVIGEHWVLWEKAAWRGQQGRVYDIDLMTGQLQFDKAAFSAYPVREDGPAVKVVFRAYHGSAANVGAGKIASLASSIRHISEVSNPMPAYGGYDGFNEKTSAGIISNMLRTRGRAVTRQDYFDIISQVSYGVRRIKCVSGLGERGEAGGDTLSIAILIDEYEKGSHIFSGVKEDIREKLMACSGLVPAGKTLILTQPRFVKMSVRLWLECERMESAYDLQKQCGESIREFIDPLYGGFGGRGWEIGVLPSTGQVVACLKIKHPDIVVSKIVMTAVYENREYAVDDQIGKYITSPFAMAVNGEHVVYCRLMEE